MRLLKCPKCGEMFSDTYKTCPFCQEDEERHSSKPVKNAGRRTGGGRAKPKVGGGTVSLKLEELPDHWQVTGTDDGVGFGLEAVREKGSIGLENVRRRIARFPGSELRITSTVGMGTQAVLTYGKRGKNMENLSKST